MTPKLCGAVLSYVADAIMFFLFVRFFVFKSANYFISASLRYQPQLFGIF